MALGKMLDPNLPPMAVLSVCEWLSIENVSAVIMARAACDTQTANHLTGVLFNQQLGNFSIFIIIHMQFLGSCK